MDGFGLVSSARRGWDGAKSTMCTFSVANDPCHACFATLQFQRIVLAAATSETTTIIINHVRLLTITSSGGRSWAISIISYTLSSFSLHASAPTFGRSCLCFLHIQTTKTFRSVSLNIRDTQDKILSQVATHCKKLIPLLGSRSNIFQSNLHISRYANLGLTQRHAELRAYGPKPISKQH